MRKNGFSLVELLVVISIIATLTAIIVPNYMGARERARDGQRIQDLESFKNALRLYYNDNQHYPDMPLNLQEIKPYLPSVDTLMINQLSSLRYYQKNNGDGFRVEIDLEAGSGDEDIRSQEQCFFDDDPDQTAVDKVYAVCAQ